jgi:hypothetical protein
MLNPRSKKIVSFWPILTCNAICSKLTCGKEMHNILYILSSVYVIEVFHHHLVMKIDNLIVNELKAYCIHLVSRLNLLCHAIRSGTSNNKGIKTL